MSTSFPTTPARLYSLLLRLSPLQAGTLMAFCGELVHGAFLRWLKYAAPEVATWLHDGNRRRLSICSSLQFPLPERHTLEARQSNVHLLLSPEKICTVRITLLLGKLLPLFQSTMGQGKAFQEPSSASARISLTVSKIRSIFFQASSCWRPPV